jgi:hypothetical protein
MRTFIFGVTIVGLLASGTPVEAAGPNAPVAVFDLSSRGLKLSLASRQNLSELLAVQLSEGGLPVLFGAELNGRIAGHKARRKGRCDDAACQRAIARSIKLDRFVSTRVMRIAKKCHLVGRLLLVDREVAVKSATAVAACDEASISAGLQMLVKKLNRARSFVPPAALSDVPIPAPEVGGEPGRLSLNSIPWGRVFINGKDLGSLTPLLDYSLSAGRHRVEVETAVGERLRAEVEIWPGESSTLILRSSGGENSDSSGVGWVSVNTRPWSQVTIDDQHVGMTPLRHRLRPGKHIVRLVFAHGETKTEEVIVRPGHTTRLVTRAATPVAFPFKTKHGLLKLHSSPWGRVWIDGKDSGKATPVFNEQLPKGKHRITIHFATGGFMTEEVVIREGETTRKIIRESR